ncbi:TIGR02450 family Trp-rich protein [Polynucleobacter sp. HIN6]|nr:TIGR02450 family Trp-rich protein [Polynucleobacter sp. HIN6]
MSRVHDPQLPSDQTIPKNYVELEAVLTKRRYLLIWTELKDITRWLNGWQ